MQDELISSADEDDVTDGTLNVTVPNIVPPVRKRTDSRASVIRPSSRSSGTSKKDVHSNKSKIIASKKGDLDNKELTDTGKNNLTESTTIKILLFSYSKAFATNR